MLRVCRRIPGLWAGATHQVGVSCADKRSGLPHACNVIAQSRPQSENELLQRARLLAGRTLGDVVTALSLGIEPGFRPAKGQVGQWMERLLGAEAQSSPVPDFPHLGVELKTLPVDARGRPRESTFVCQASVTSLRDETWVTSRVRRKLSRVLWVPVESDPGLAFEERRMGTPWLWRPNDEEERVLRADWEDLADLAVHGFAEAVGGRRGTALQLRPKARDASTRQRTRALGLSGDDEEPCSLRPSGFYLRASFTATLLQRAFAPTMRGTEPSRTDSGVQPEP